MAKLALRCRDKEDDSKEWNDLYEEKAGECALRFFSLCATGLLNYHCSDR